MTVAIVTGGSSGIGKSAAIEIARRGAGVILTYGRNGQGASEAVATIERAGGRAVALSLDVGNSESFPAFRDAVSKALKDTWNTDSFTSLVNNAGIARSALLENTSEEMFDELMRVLFKGPYFLTQTLLPLLEDGGAIVNTTSNTALFSGMEPGYSAYGSMKGGMVVLTQYMAREFSKRGIRVNSVSPGATRTRLGGDAFAKYPELIEPIAAKTAFGHVGEPEDIGMVIAALVSEECRWITGQNIEASGGYNM